jgi:hypothetical protein
VSTEATTQTSPSKTEEDADLFIPALIAEYRSTVCFHIFELISHLPDKYKGEFAKETKWLKTQYPLSENKEGAPKKKQEFAYIQDAYSVIKRAKKLKQHALASFITSDYNFNSVIRHDYLSLKAIVLCSIARLLNIDNSSDYSDTEDYNKSISNCIEQAANEVRWIVTGRRADVLSKFPELDQHDFRELIEQIDTLRQDVNAHVSKKDALQTILSRYHTLFSNAYDEQSGIRRRRKSESTHRHFSLLQRPVDYDDDSDVSITEVTSKLRAKGNQSLLTEEREEFDNTPPNQNVFSVSINEQSTKDNQLNALLAHRYADQLKVRAISADADYTILTAHEAAVLVHECTQNYKDDASGLLLTAFAFGIKIQGLYKEKVKYKLDVKSSYIQLTINHKLPHSSLRSKKLPLLSNTIYKLDLKIKNYFIFKKDNELQLNIANLMSEAKSHLSLINKKHNTRLTLGRIEKYKTHWLRQRGTDETITSVITGEEVTKNAGQSYANFNTNELISIHSYYLSQHNLSCPENDTKSLRIGSKLYVNQEHLIYLVNRLRENITQAQSLGLTHPFLFTEYSLYTQLILALSSGYRPVNDWFGSIGDYNLINGNMWISDKERRNSLSARLIWLPQIAVTQIQHYLAYLNYLVRYWRFSKPIIGQRIQGALDGTAPLFFWVYDSKQNYHSVELPEMTDTAAPLQSKKFEIKPEHAYELLLSPITPRTFEYNVSRILPLPLNWHRHFMRSEFAERKLSPELIDAWMGHDQISAESLGIYSSLSVHTLKQIAPLTNAILSDLDLQSLDLLNG